jgi:hypothetical protein
MDAPTVLRIVTVLTGLVIAGEALALLVGMRVLSGAGNPWVSPKNDAFLGLDILAGLGLILVALLDSHLFASGAFYLLALTSLLAHGTRDWECLARVENAFCANVPLFAVNNLKLLGLLVALVVGLGLWFTRR